MSKLSIAIILVCSITASIAATQNDDVYLAVRRNCDQSDSPPIQGRPGKKGVVGSQGVKGDKGSLGLKGEAGVCNASEILKLTNQVHNLTEQLANSRQQIQNLETSINRLNQQNSNLTEKIDNLSSSGWYTPWNGYQYKLTTTKRNWQDSRIACQAMGGDLAVNEMMDYNTTKKIGQALIEDSATWIGLNDIASEGRFVWIDGTTSTFNNTHWIPGQPDDWNSDEDCAEIWKNSEYRLNDNSCRALQYGLCEKQLV